MLPENGPHKLADDTVRYFSKKSYLIMYSCLFLLIILLFEIKYGKSEKYKLEIEEKRREADHEADDATRSHLQSAAEYQS